MPLDPTPPRIVPVPGAHNLRDLGGYRTADGRRLKWRRLYRSGQISRIATADIAPLGLAAVCDLRDNPERAREPARWPLELTIDYWSRAYAMSAGDMHDLASIATAPPGTMFTAMRRIYRELPYEQAPAYNEIFRRLTAGQLPLMFNCAAGKDRTGIAAALILAALNVPRATILEDYVLSDHGIEHLTALLASDPKFTFLNTAQKELYLPMLRADPTYLTTMFDEIEHKEGSVAGYLNNVLNVGATQINALREHLLE